MTLKRIEEFKKSLNYIAKLLDLEIEPDSYEFMELQATCEAWLHQNDCFKIAVYQDSWSSGLNFRIDIAVENEKLGIRK